MWLMTPRGMFSAVNVGPDPEVLSIRGRVLGDLENLLDDMEGRQLLDGPRPPVEVSTQRDYAYRVTLSKGEWMRACAMFAVDVSYSNFKDEVKRQQGSKRASVYMRVWSALLDLQPEGMHYAFPREDWADDTDDLTVLTNHLPGAHLEWALDLAAGAPETDYKTRRGHHGRNRAVREFLRNRKGVR